MNLMHPIFGIGRKMFSGYDIPPQEVAELYKLYTQTGGPSWTDHTNWFENKSCVTWYGLTVAGGRVTKIGFNGVVNGLAGVSNFSPKPFAALTSLDLRSEPNLCLSFHATDLPSVFQWINLSGTKSVVVGAITDFAPNAILRIYLDPSPSIITGSLSDIRPQNRWFSANSPIMGGSVPVKVVSVNYLRVSGQPTDIKDSIIERIYADRALFTDAAHTLNISGGGALTGVYQTSAAPSTPAEKAYALVNDQNAEGFLKWVITL